MGWPGFVTASRLCLLAHMLLTGAAFAEEQTPAPIADPAASSRAAEGCEGADSQTFSEFIKPGWNQLANYPGNQQLMIFASDPQAYRYMAERKPFREEIDEPGWKAAVTRTLSAIRAERMSKNYYVPLVINGDMTEYGHGDERRDTRNLFRQQLAGGVGGPLMLPGLGNHDYSNNVDDCGNNGCARDATCDQITWVQAISPKTGFDYRYNGSTHTGSLSYAVAVGRVELIQLNLEPTYTRSWSTGGFPNPNPKRYFKITDSMAWFAGALADARRRNQVIIVNLHKDWEWQRNIRITEFADLLIEYGVSAVFAGHIHDSVGYAGSIVGVPVYRSGGLQAHSYLQTLFDWNSMKLTVQPVLKDQSTQPSKSITNLISSGNPQGLAIRFSTAANGSEICSLRNVAEEYRLLKRLDCDSPYIRTALIYNMQPGKTVCFQDGTGLTERCFSSTTFRGRFSADLTGSNPQVPAGMEVVSVGSLSNAVSMSATPQVRSINVVLFAQESEWGDTCEFRLAAGAPLTPLRDTRCSGFESKAASARLEGFSAGESICLQGTQANSERCYWGDYEGDVHLRTLSGIPTLPKGIWYDHKGGALTKGLSSVSHTANVHKTMWVNVYDKPNRQGNTCAFAYAYNADYLDLSGTPCAGFRNRAASLQIAAFSSATSVCLQGAENREWCLSGPFNGTFNLDNLQGMTNWATGAQGRKVEIKGGALHNNLHSISNREVKPTTPEILLFEGERVTGASCRLPLPQGVAVTRLSASPCDGWQNRASSAFVNGLAPGQTVCIQGYSGERCFTSRHADGFRIDYLNLAPDLPAGTEMVARGYPITKDIVSIAASPQRPGEEEALQVTLYDRPGMIQLNSKCSIVVPPGIYYLSDFPCPVDWSTVTTGSMKVKRFASGGVFGVLGRKNGVPANRGYRGSYEGPFDVPDMQKEHALPEGLSMSQSAGGIEQIGQIVYRVESSQAEAGH